MRLVQWEGQGGRRIEDANETRSWDPDSGEPSEMRREWWWWWWRVGKVVAAAPEGGGCRDESARSLASNYKSHSTHTLQGTTQPSQTALITLSQQWKCFCLEDWPDPPECPYTLDLLLKPRFSEWLTLGESCIDFEIGSLVSSFQIAIQSVPHSWCCILLDLLWFNKCSSKPPKPTPRNKPWSTFLLSNSTL